MNIKNMNITKPMILSLSGHDPSGGAGIQADIEAIHAFGCHATSVITCLTRQNTNNVYQIEPVKADFLLKQAQTLLNDMPVHAFKIGLIGSIENIHAIQQIISLHPSVPVILDPVLAAGGGQDLSSKQIAQAIVDLLVPLTTVITPNIPEAQQLADQQDNDSCAQFFSSKGCQYTLITGTHSNTKEVTNTLYQNNKKTLEVLSRLSWPRLSGIYHGSGCTLASAIAARIGTGLTIENAVNQAQKYTWESLNQASHQGKGQLIPYR
jgi:hydroxymethylpyrimidine/phosphomethylpyrimidine kinase